MDNQQGDDEMKISDGFWMDKFADIDIVAKLEMKERNDKEEQKRKRAYL